MPASCPRLVLPARTPCPASSQRPPGSCVLLWRLLLPQAAAQKGTWPWGARGGSSPVRTSSWWPPPLRGRSALQGAASLVCRILADPGGVGLAAASVLSGDPEAPLLAVAGI